MANTGIYITGTGCISALGKTVSENWENLRRGNTAISPVQQIDNTLLSVKNAAEVDYSPDDYFPGKKRVLLDRFTQFSLIAAQEAITDAVLDTRHYAPRIGVILGTGVGARHTNDEALYELYGRKRRIPPTSIPKGLFHAPASFISIEHGITGPAYMITSACASSNHAISMAASMIQSGMIDVAITGGTEACISLPFYKGWEALRIMDPDISRPFSKERNGFNLGEGAGILVLERDTFAEDRGAPVRAVISGFGMSSDAFDILKMSEAGAAQAMQNALDNADLTASQIGYINAHGTGTVLNDKTETRAIRTVFGNHADKLRVSSTKSMHGHALGASGAIEAVATIKALEEQFVPPTANFLTPDVECDLNYIPNTGEPLSFDHAMSNSFAFGGVNSVVVYSLISK